MKSGQAGATGGSGTQVGADLRKGTGNEHVACELSLDTRPGDAHPAPEEVRAAPPTPIWLLSPNAHLGFISLDSLL